MVVAPFLFKAKAVQALKGNWQTALLISFFAEILFTGTSLVTNTGLPAVPMDVTADQLLALVQKVPNATWALLGGLQLISLLVTPMLHLGANHYFVCRLNGQELGFSGLFSRAKYFGKALWLSVLVNVRIFLWSLLLVVPGIVAALRYSMAFYYLAEDPTLTAWEAIEKSKNAMKSTKTALLLLTLSFMGWVFLATAAQLLLSDMNMIVALVVGQFLQLFVTTYMNGAYAAFFQMVSDPKGMESYQRSLDSMMRDPAGGTTASWRAPFMPGAEEMPEEAGEEKDPTEEEEPAEQTKQEDDSSGPSQEA